MKNIAARRLILPVLSWLASGALWAGTEGTSSTFFGTGAGATATGTSGNNTFIGLNAGTSTTTAGNPRDTFVGSGAGFSNTTAFRNSFFGSNAGFHTTTGSNNSFFGESAGAANTVGDLNAFFGLSAGASNTTATSNTFIGAASGASNTTGASNTFVGHEAGVNNIDGNTNVFVGSVSGRDNASGAQNVFVGHFSGLQNDTGSANTYVGYETGTGTLAGVNNTYLGAEAGFVATGSNNVFVGFSAGANELGSHRLYIDNCLSGGNCTVPFIYGEFDNHLLKVNGVLNVRANGVAKSQMHFSQNDTDTGGYLTSVLDNNFFVSSGARYDSGNWVQRSPDTNAVMAGSGGVGYRIFTHTGTAVGNTFNNPTLRLHIDYSGQFGINTAPVGGDEIHTSSGAHLTSGGVWTDASSREYKEHIRALTTEEAQQAIAALDPVRYNYKANPDEKHVGFIAEDVPALVATKDRRSLSPMDIVAVLTKVTQQKGRMLDEQKRTIERQQAELAQLKGQLASLAERMQRLEQSSATAR